MDTRELLYRNPRLVVVLNLILSLAVLAAVLIAVRTILISSSARTTGPREAMDAKPKQDKKALKDYEVILRSNPFGIQAGPLRQLATRHDSAQPHTDLALIGTISGASTHSYAVFADKTGRQEVFKIGEPVFGSGRLKQVEKDQVFIESNGREVKIPLAEMLTIREVASVDTTRPVSDLARSAGSGTYLVDQKKIQYALEHPNQLMTDARLQPNLTNGRQEGFVLREVRQGGIYHSLGLQNGDVLLRINEYAISNPENALQAFTALRGLDRVQVDLLRGGSKMTMTYQIR